MKGTKKTMKDIKTNFNGRHYSNHYSNENFLIYFVL